MEDQSSETCKEIGLLVAEKQFEKGEPQVENEMTFGLLSGTSIFKQKECVKSTLENYVLSFF